MIRFWIKILIGIFEKWFKKSEWWVIFIFYVSMSCFIFIFFVLLLRLVGGVVGGVFSVLIVFG